MATTSITVIGNMVKKVSCINLALVALKARAIKLMVKTIPIVIIKDRIIKNRAIVFDVICLYVFECLA